MNSVFSVVAIIDTKSNALGLMWIFSVFSAVEFIDTENSAPGGLHCRNCPDRPRDTVAWPPGSGDGNGNPGVDSTAKADHLRAGSPSPLAAAA